MLRKPARILGRDVEWQELTAFAAGCGPRLGIVTGRRRQGKTLLLEALARATGGLYLGAPRATEAESMRLLADELASYTGGPPVRFAGWCDVARHLLDTAVRTGRPVVVDDLAHLPRELPAVLARELARVGGASFALLLSGSVPAVMADATARLREHVTLELAVRPLDHAAAARLWGIADPRVAVQVHAVLGGTAAYRRLAYGDAPADEQDVDAWVQRTVLEPLNPLFGEARYLLESADVRDTALYGSLLAAVPAGDGGRGAIADHVGRRSADIGHHLNVLEDCGLLHREPDVFRAGRTTYRIAEPLVAFHHVVTRPRQGLLECGRAAEVWKEARPRFDAQLLEPHFARLCRAHAGGGSGVVTDGRRHHIPVDVAVFAPAVPGEPPRIRELGTVRWGSTIGATHVARLRTARELLGARGFDVRDTRLTCYAAAGVERSLVASGELTIVRPAALYP